MQLETPEQRSRDLQKAQRNLADVQERHAKSLQTIQHLRQTLHEVNNGLTDPASEAGRRVRARVAELREQMTRALAERDKAREELEVAKTAAREAESAACTDLVESQRNSYSKSVASYWRERLKRIEAEAVPLLEAFATREALEIALGIRRQAKVGRLPVTAGMVKEHGRLQIIRNQVTELIEAGMVSEKDVPASLRKQWNI